MMNGFILELDNKITQENAALVEESTAAAEMLRHEGHALHENVSFFKLGNTQATTGLQKARPFASAPNSRSTRPVASQAKKPMALPAPARKASANKDEWSDF